MSIFPLTGPQSVVMIGAVASEGEGEEEVLMRLEKTRERKRRKELRKTSVDIIFTRFAA